MVNLRAMDKRKVLLLFIVQFFILFNASPIALLGYLMPLIWIKHNIKISWHSLLRASLPLWLIVCCYILVGSVQLHAPFFQLHAFTAQLTRQATFLTAIPHSVLLTHLISGRDVQQIISWLMNPVIGEKKAANLGLALALSYHFMPRVEQLWVQHHQVLSVRGLTKPRLKKWLLCSQLTITALFLGVEQKHDAILARGYHENMSKPRWQHTSHENMILPSLLSYAYVVNLLFRVIP